MIKVEVLVPESKLNCLKTLSDHGYVYRRDTTTGYLPGNERAQVELVTMVVDSKAQAEAISKLIEMDVQTSTTQVIKFTPETEVSTEPVAKPILPPTDDTRIQELFQERVRSQKMHSKPLNCPIWSYAVRNPTTNKASSVVFYSEGYCDICSSSQHLQLVELGGEKRVLCNTDVQIESMEGDVVSYGALASATKNLYSTNNIGGQPEPAMKVRQDNRSTIERVFDSHSYEGRY
jgi:hypothetical protein